MLGARWAVRTAAPPWLLARAVVLASLAVARELTSDGRLSAQSASRVRQGLLGWDAGWYEAIAKHGYAGAGPASLRFFPLVPAVARALAEVPGVSVGVALVVVSNLCALAAAALLASLVRRETGDAQFARRAAWLLCLAPPAFVFIMGYAESTFVMLCVGAFLCMRRRRWWAAAALSVLAGLARPLGALLVVPAAIECARAWSHTHPARSTMSARSTRSSRTAALVSVIGGPLGCGAFLAWCGWRYGDAFAPLRIQEEAGHRGALADPFSTLGHDASLLVHGSHLGTAFHLPWVILAVLLAVVAAVRLPASYAGFAFLVLAVALTASNLDSFERYALSAFPLVIAGASLDRSPRAETAVLVLAAAGLACYSLLAFTGLYVP
ncbi:MAG: mannosyltransferase family protein [Acidimicrobiales bacterium]